MLPAGERFDFGFPPLLVRLGLGGLVTSPASFRFDPCCVSLVLSPEGSADLLGREVNELKIEGAPRGLLAASVADVDAAYEELKVKGVTFLRPPTDQAWGLRTAHFADPEGNLWEINQSIGTKPEG